LLLPFHGFQATINSPTTVEVSDELHPELTALIVPPDPKSWRHSHGLPYATKYWQAGDKNCADLYRGREKRFGFAAFSSWRIHPSSAEEVNSLRGVSGSFASTAHVWGSISIFPCWVQQYPAGRMKRSSPRRAFWRAASSERWRSRFNSNSLMVPFSRWSRMAWLINLICAHSCYYPDAQLWQSAHPKSI